jgi:hypothetical protein
MHRLVCLGDSATQGFKSGAIFEPGLSFPAIIAWEMGLSGAEFRYPDFSGEGGLPVNIEVLLRRIDREFGRQLERREIPLAGIHLQRWMDAIEDYWERGAGSQPLLDRGPHHNLSVWGFELQDARQLSAGLCEEIIGTARDGWLSQIPEQAMYRTARRVLNPSHSREPEDLEATQLGRAAELARDGGIENLIVFLGANNVLSSVTGLRLEESTDADLDRVDPRTRTATVYRPEHFDELLKRLMDDLEALVDGGGRIDRVFWGTVPPVTIPPVTHGVGGRMESAGGLRSPFDPGDDPHWFRRYFKAYTRPWVSSPAFRKDEDPHLTGEQVIRIDQTIARYREILRRRVQEHNQARRGPGRDEDWFLVDTHWALERIAHRRYLEDPSVPPPPGWTRYRMPELYERADLDTRFLRARGGRRVSGGLFSLDGVHPTTAGYGLVAQEFIDVMERAGVRFFHAGGTPRRGPIAVDFERVLELDSLIGNLPKTLEGVWDLLVEGDQILDLLKRAWRAGSGRGPASIPG